MENALRIDDLPCTYGKVVIVPHVNLPEGTVIQYIVGLKGCNCNILQQFVCHSCQSRRTQKQVRFDSIKKKVRCALHIPSLLFRVGRLGTLATLVLSSCLWFCLCLGFWTTTIRSWVRPQDSWSDWRKANTGSVCRQVNGVVSLKSKYIRDASHHQYLHSCAHHQHW